VSKRKLFAGIASVSLPVFIQDTTSTTGAGISGVTHTSSGLVLEYRRHGQSSWTSVTPVSKTLGTYTSGGIVADGSLAGAYEVDFPDAAFAAGSRFVLFRIRGVANMLAVLIEVELDAVDYQTDAFGALKPTTAGRTLDVSAGGEAGIDLANVGSPTSTLNLSGTTIKAVTDGVTVTTNNDKGNYSLSTAGIQAIWDALTSALTTAGSIGKWIIDNLNTTVASRATQTSVDAIDDFVDTEVGAIKTVTDKLDTMVELDGAVYRYTTNALEQAPSGGGGGSTDWTSDERTAIRAILGIPTSGTTPTDPTTGILDTIRDLVVVVDTVVDRIEVDTQDIQSRLPASLQDGRIVAYVGVNNDKTGYSLLVAPPTAATIADAVWADTDADDVIRSAVGLGSANLDSQLSAALVLQKLAASGATGSVQVTDNGNGTATLVFKDTNGSTTLATVTYNYTTGARTRVS
jgi:hypothetical protein